MRVLGAFVAELRERRLWPVVVVLLAGIVAVPIVLAKGASPRPTQAPPSSGVPVSANPASPSVSLASNLAATPPQGLARDPFAQPLGTGVAHAAASAASISSSLPASPASSPSTAGGGGGGGGIGPATPTTTNTTTTPTTTEPTTPPADAPTKARIGLSATQAYRVTLAITTSGGGLDTISPLERLSVLPGQRDPMLVELGVLHGGRRVLFAVQPGAVVSGRGTCIPGPINCQILSLAPAQTETLSSADRTGSRVLLAVTAVTAARYPSAAAAEKARRTASASGRKLLSGSILTALPLFHYDPALGAVLDLRNVTVGHR
jgi:hypothetical protein